MPSLTELRDPKTRAEFVRQVVEGAKNPPKQDVSVNAGFKNSEELCQHILKGRHVPFDYQRLIDESDAY